MTVYEVLKFLGEPLERLTKAGIKTNDYKYIKNYMRTTIKPVKQAKKWVMSWLFLRNVTR